MKITIMFFDRPIEAEVVTETETHYVVKAELVAGKPLRWDIHKDSDQIVELEPVS